MRTYILCIGAIALRYIGAACGFAPLSDAPALAMHKRVPMQYARGRPLASSGSMCMAAQPILPPPEVSLYRHTWANAMELAVTAQNMFPITAKQEGVFPTTKPLAHLSAATAQEIDITVIYAGGAAAALLLLTAAVASSQKSKSVAKAGEVKRVNGVAPFEGASTTPAAAAPIFTKVTPAAAAPIKQEAPKTQEEIARAYDIARSEQLEIDRIKNDFIAKIERAGRQSTIRLETMSKSGVAPVSSSGSTEAKKTDNLPEEVYLRSAPMNLAKRNALEANRKQWGIDKKIEVKAPEAVAK